MELVVLAKEAKQCDEKSFVRKVFVAQINYVNPSVEAALLRAKNKVANATDAETPDSKKKNLKMTDYVIMLELHCDKL